MMPADDNPPLVRLANEVPAKARDAAAPTILRLTFEGRPIAAAPGDSVAAALLMAGEHHWRDSVGTGAPRGPWCLMGSCFECVMLIDGVSRQACMTPARDGMRIRRRARLHDLEQA